MTTKRAAVCKEKLYLAFEFAHFYHTGMSVTPTVNWRQIKTLTGASIKSRYRNTIVGVIWVVLSPLLMFAAQAYVIKAILKIEHSNTYLFLLIGLLPWLFLTTSLNMSTSILVTNAKLFKSFPIHPVSSICSVILDNLINFLLAFSIVLTGLFAFGTSLPSPHFLLIPVPIFFLFIFVFSLAWLLACLQVFFHDVRFVMDSVSAVMFFITPILYPAKLIPAQFLWLVAINPVAALLSPIQALSEETLPPDYLFQIIKAALISFGFLLAAWKFWVWKKNDIYFRL